MKAVVEEICYGSEINLEFVRRGLVSEEFLGHSHSEMDEHSV